MIRSLKKTQSFQRTSELGEAQWMPILLQGSVAAPLADLSNGLLYAFQWRAALEAVLARTVAASNNLSFYDMKQHFHLACLKPLVVNLIHYLWNKLKILEFDSNKTKECLILSSFIVISIFAVLAYGFWELRGKNPVLSWIERVEKSERINPYLRKYIYSMTSCKILSLLANRQIKLIFWKWEMSKRKKKKCLVKVQTSVKRRVYVCVSLCLHTGSHVKRISRPWSNKVPSHSQSTMKGRSHSISALCPAQKKERQTRGVGEKRREEKINGKC